MVPGSRTEREHSWNFIYSGSFRFTS